MPNAWQLNAKINIFRPISVILESGAFPEVLRYMPESYKCSARENTNYYGGLSNLDDIINPILTDEGVRVGTFQIKVENKCKKTSDITVVAYAEEHQTVTNYYSSSGRIPTNELLKCGNDACRRYFISEFNGLVRNIMGYYGCRIKQSQFKSANFSEWWKCGEPETLVYASGNKILTSRRREFLSSALNNFKLDCHFYRSDGQPGQTHWISSENPSKTLSNSGLTLNQRLNPTNYICLNDQETTIIMEIFHFRLDANLIHNCSWFNNTNLYCYYSQMSVDKLSIEVEISPKCSSLSTTNLFAMLSIVASNQFGIYITLDRGFESSVRNGHKIIIQPTTARFEKEQCRVNIWAIVIVKQSFASQFRYPFEVKVFIGTWTPFIQWPKFNTT